MSEIDLWTRQEKREKWTLIGVEIPEKFPSRWKINCLSILIFKTSLKTEQKKKIFTLNNLCRFCSLNEKKGDGKKTFDTNERHESERKSRLTCIKDEG